MASYTANNIPNFSAKIVLTQRVAFVLVALCVTCVALFSLDFRSFLYLSVITINFLYFMANVYKLIIFWHGYKLSNRDAKEDFLENEKLPKYTILVPLFKESKVIRSLINSLSEIDYPEDRLQVLLILEEIDYDTIKAIESIELPSSFKTITVPYSLPQTKAKACNYVLNQITGELVVIFDAEDKPHKLQLKRVASRFAKEEIEVACIQCSLGYYNATENWLTKMFQLEYIGLFKFFLPALDAWGYPIPLGGTSNHIKTEVLRKVGGWDSYNVTEDAELGLRLKFKEYKIKTINCLTEEEAPISLSAWLKQRSRWIKGYIHTFFAYIRHPYYLFKAFKLNGFIFFCYLFCLCPFFLFTAPAISFVTIIFVLNFYELLGVECKIIGMFFLVNLFLKVGSLLFYAYVAAISSDKDGKKITLWWTYPFYFFLHIVAAIMALYKLCKEPHKWDKTEHGLSKYQQNENQIDSVKV